MNSAQVVLFATLGTEAQVIPAGLDLLLKTGEGVVELGVFHCTAPGTAISAAVEQLVEVSNTGYYPGIDFRFIPFRNQQGEHLRDIESTQDGQDCFNGIYAQVRKAKLDGKRVHLLVAGGRKLASIYAMVCAQILFDEEDRLWYLHSSGAFLAGKRMHPQLGDEVALVPVPVVLWSRMTPAFERLRQAENPTTALKVLETLQIQEKMEVCRSFVLGALTPSEARVVKELVLYGLGDQEIGDSLYLSPRTVEQHLRSAYAKAVSHWELEGVTRTQLVMLLNMYFAAEVRGKPA